MKTVFVDIDSQLDFLYPSGALYVQGAERIVPAIARLNRYAAQHGIPVVSTTDAHTENDPEFKIGNTLTDLPSYTVWNTIAAISSHAILLPILGVVFGAAGAALASLLRRRTMTSSTT